MKILKFGGTSVGSIDGLHSISSIISETPNRKIIVCSAMSGVTDILLELATQIQAQDFLEMAKCLDVLKTRHFTMIEALFHQKTDKDKVKEVVLEALKEIKTLAKKSYCDDVECIIVTYGERLLTKIFSTYLHTKQIHNVLLDARDFMEVDEVEKPDTKIIRTKLVPILEKHQETTVFITQGFIRMTSAGKLRHLRRGGSDYSATLIGAAIDADEVQIWSDIDGFHNCNPNLINNTVSLPYLSYDESAKLAYFGAKILHPQTVFPIKNLEIPLRLKDTYKSHLEGTLIANEKVFSGRKAISIKNDLIRLQLTPLSNYSKTYILKEAYRIFSEIKIKSYLSHETEAYAEVVVAKRNTLHTLIKNLEEHYTVTVENDISIVCIVGYDHDVDSVANQLAFDLAQYTHKILRSKHDTICTKLMVKSKNSLEILQVLDNKLFAEKVNVPQ